MSRSDERRSFAAMFFLGIVTLWGQIENDVLRAVDSPCYAVIAKELSAKSPWDWVSMSANGKLFFEHPHFTPWLLALWMKLFGVSTTSALVPIVILSTLTLWLAYAIGRKLLDHSFGLLAGFVLLFTPSFIKDGRNPMLEPALMFFIMLSLYFNLRFFKKDSGLNGVWAGLAFGFAILSKGPPAILAPLVLVAFYLATLFFSEAFKEFQVSVRSFLAHVFSVLGVGLGLIALVDLWSLARTGSSFFSQYMASQLQYTLVNSRGVTENVWKFYFPNFFEYYPWIFLMYLSVPLMVWQWFKKKTVLVPAFIFGWLVTLGVFLGFTVIKHKGFWYTNIHYVGSSLIAAIPLWLLLSKVQFQKIFTIVCGVIAVGVLFFSATFPSLFDYPRPLEHLLAKASKEYKTTWQGKVIANCTELNPWRGSFLFQFYLGAQIGECDAQGATLKLVNLRTAELPEHVKIRIAGDPFALIDVPVK